MDSCIFAPYLFASVIGTKEKKIRRRVPYVLSLMGLNDKARNYPRELSGGEQQRVALARALANNAEIIIADFLFFGTDNTHCKRNVIENRHVGNKSEILKNNAESAAEFRDISLFDFCQVDVFNGYRSRRRHLLPHHKLEEGALTGAR